MNSANILVLVIAIALLLISFLVKYATYTGQIKLERYNVAAMIVFVGAAFLAFYIGLRWVPAIENAINHKYSKQDNPMQYNVTLSWSFLLDFCPMISVVISLSMCTKMGRKFLGHISPLVFYAGAMVIFGSKIVDSKATLSFGYLILGNQEPGIPYNTITVGMHLYILTVGFNALLYKDKLNRYDALIIAIFVGLFLSYVAILMTIFDVTSYTSGLNQWDFIGSEQNYVPAFNFFYKLFKGVPIWALPILTYLFHLIVTLIFSYIKVWSCYMWPSKTTLDYSFFELTYLLSFKKFNRTRLLEIYNEKYRRYK